MTDYFRRNTELSDEDLVAIRERNEFFWEDYLGCSDNMVHFRHGSYRLRDIVNAMYPDEHDPRRTAMLLKYSK
jgi:hypothetical protein